MKAILVGAGSTAIMTAKFLLEHNHDVIVIEVDKERIDELSHELDCGFLLGDGSKPSLLRETNPEEGDVLYCLTGHDQTNIIASLVGRSLGFKKVVTKIQDPTYEHICIELGLEATIVPSRTIGRHLAELFEGRDSFELSTMLRYDTSVFSFVAREKQVGGIADLALPKSSRIMCIYRKGKLIIPEDNARIEPDDEVIIITHRKNLEALHEQLDSVGHYQSSDSG
ncbi:trk system potassium uptake protein TrkA [Marinobacter sp. es.042]|jgi:trk system potassium uptake protein TrkA|uniref:potassium channel family protein n=1 Tax=Marinobacter sp. es.042 TaxID=1761794 RepID=UPI000B50283F|nr:NAD-binding protein [Marinobacter sp. es.042]SNB58389.1 trk system potassium uptake protein TrkA [Marinobacter sp. es.042]